MSRIIEEAKTLENMPDSNFFKIIAVNIWERDMGQDGIDFRRTADYLKYMFNFSPVGMQIFGDNVLQQMTLLQGAARNRGYGNEANDILFTQVIADLELMLAHEDKQNLATPEASLQLLDQIFIPRLTAVEEKAKEQEGEISQWPKIRIAAFVETIFEKKWLLEKKNRIKSSNNFSKARYGIDIEASLGGGAKLTARMTHKEQLKKYF